MRPNELWTCPDDGAAREQASGCRRSSHSVGPFEGEEEGTGILSEVDKVEGGDPATPGYYLRIVDTRKPRDRNDFPISG